MEFASEFASNNDKKSQKDCSETTITEKNWWIFENESRQLVFQKPQVPKDRLLVTSLII